MRELKIISVPPVNLMQRIKVLDFCYEHHQNFTRKKLTEMAKKEFDYDEYKYYQYLWKRNYLQHDYGGFAMLGLKGGLLRLDYKKRLS